MKNYGRSFVSAIQSTSAAALVAFCGSALAVVSAGPIIYGSLGNFDVVNNTGQPCNGFEIELEGVSPGDVVYTFGDTGGANPTKYIRYGKPTIVPTSTGTIIRYASQYGAGRFSDATPIAPSPTPVTMGHQCWVYGDPNYPYSGCEHFGMSLVKNPTKTSYRWLVGDPATGTLKVAGLPGSPSIPAPVNVPPPVWNVKLLPPAVGAPPVPQVVAVVEAPRAPPAPPGGKGQWGEPIWMKIYMTELPQRAELDDLLLGGNPNRPGILAVPDGSDPLQVEVEWQLLQSPPVGKVGNFSNDNKFGVPGAGHEAVSRRYEYYKYTGMSDTDPDNLGEALCDNPTALNQRAKCGVPDTNGVAGVGDLIGAQNAAANLVPMCAANVTQSITVKRSGYAFNFSTRLFSQKITMTNAGKATIFGPISLVLDNLNLSGSDGLLNRFGITQCAAPLGSSFVVTPINAKTAGLAPGASVDVVLQFSNAARIGINYNTRVLSTAGSQ